MDESFPIRGPKGLTEIEFSLLLSSLDPDRDRAGEAYVALWHKLMHYFRVRACKTAEESADETLNRVARKIAAGEEIRNVPAYCHGVARLVWMEYTKRPGSNTIPLDEMSPKPMRNEDELEREERMTIFRHCLQELPRAEAQLLVRYWHHDDASNRDARRDMAIELGISATALRLRIFRIKAKFEECFTKRLGKGLKT